MIEARIDRSFESWRAEARALLGQNIAPERVIWVDSSQSEMLLSMFGGRTRLAAVDSAVRVSKEFLDIARYVACFREPERWAILYRVLWRLTHGEPNLLKISIDDDIRKLDEMHRKVRRDRHKMTAFVRFRRIESQTSEQYAAWYEPDHYIVKLAASHFKDRFSAMHWTIFTPDDSVSWDGNELSFGPGVSRESAPQQDELEELWKAYYATTFNPARIKLNAMRKEMPVRFWKNLPETQQINDLLIDAPNRVEAMMKYQTNISSAKEYVPATRSLPQLKEALRGCKGCELYCNATQAVFGEGPVGAKVMFVGEQPGDQEDLAGRPFVGPAGRLLDEMLEEVGIDRTQIYLTNSVKHFKFEQRGKRRIHATPNAREAAACKPWLTAEIETVKPQMIVCLGATAAKNLMGNQFRITQSRGQVFTDQTWSPWMLATYHPSALLRVPDPDLASKMRQELTSDLQTVLQSLQKCGQASQ